MKAVLGCIALSVAGASSAAEPEAKFTHEEVRVSLEAGAAFYSAWPSGKTIHSGIGYIPPYGAADYWCGVGYAEAKPFPIDSVVAPWMLTNAQDKQPLFCVYRTKAGDIYAYDILIGPIEQAPAPRKEKRDSLVNYVVGGTGKFAGATGVWVGTASGRGNTSKSGNGIDWPQSIIKSMDGYVRLPQK